MASAVTTTRPTSNIKIKLFDFDPGGSDPVDIGWEDFRDFGWAVIGFMRSVGTGAVDSFKILANAQSNGGGTDAEVKAHAAPTVADAVGDQLFLECLAEELPPLGSSLRYLSGSLELATDTDECVAVYVFGEPRFAYDGLTADIVA